MSPGENRPRKDWDMPNSKTTRSSIHPNPYLPKAALYRSNRELATQSPHSQTPSRVGLHCFGVSHARSWLGIGGERFVASGSELPGFSTQSRDHRSATESHSHPQNPCTPLLPPLTSSITDSKCCLDQHVSSAPSQLSRPAQKPPVRSTRLLPEMSPPGHLLNAE